MSRVLAKGCKQRTMFCFPEVYIVFGILDCTRTGPPVSCLKKKPPKKQNIGVIREPKYKLYVFNQRIFFQDKNILLPGWLLPMTKVAPQSVSDVILTMRIRAQLPLGWSTYLCLRFMTSGGGNEADQLCNFTEFTSDWSGNLRRYGLNYFTSTFHASPEMGNCALNQGQTIFLTLECMSVHRALLQ